VEQVCRICRRFAEDCKAFGGHANPESRGDFFVRLVFVSTEIEAVTPSAAPYVNF
jgi:hypothetical protein